MNSKQALKLVKELKDCNKGAVHDVLKKHGITFESKERGQYVKYDNAIVALLKEHGGDLGLAGRTIFSMLAKKTEFSAVTITAFRNRLVMLTKSKVIKYEREIGTFKFNGTVRKPKKA